MVNRLVPARWIDLGLVPPGIFHAAYEVLAERLSDGDPPVILWGRCHTHICLGQHQNRDLELDPDIDVPVIQRPLGGGTVWIDPAQYCFALVVPLARLRRRPAEWYAWALEPALQTYRAHGLAAEMREHDLWLSGRKIAGSGAATIGRGAVVASSFLLDFPAERFARCVACPSEGFRDWLVGALLDAMTDWMSHQAPPDGVALARVFREQCAAAFGWAIANSPLSDTELAAIENAAHPPDEVWESGAERLVPHGIKLNAAVYLTERHEDEHWARTLTVEGKIARIALSEPLPEFRLRQLAQCTPALPELRACLASIMPAEQASLWANLILQTSKIS